MRIDPHTGLSASAEQKNSIFEVFAETHLPSAHPLSSAPGGVNSNSPYSPENENAEPIF
jgi:hypothetical protein